MMMVMNHCMIIFAFMMMTRMLTETVVISDNPDYNVGAPTHTPPMRMAYKERDEDDGNDDKECD